MKNLFLLMLFSFKEVTRYLSTGYFNNMMLLPWNSNTPEPIVSDPNKFTLIVFSTSYCGPRKQIPIVKNLHDRIGEKLNVVYVSIDEKDTVKDWLKMTKDGDVPGRNLLALGQMEKVRSKYFIRTIPYSILVRPGGKMEEVNVSLETDIKKINQIVEISG